MNRLRHEPALDGLRAVAVAVVLLYHGGVSWLPGGFLGVHVFLALSGYLITALLLAEHAATGGIDLVAFWSRRARRLLPALLLVLLGVAAYAAVLAGPDELARIRGDGLASLAYVANWRMIFSGDSYFEQFTAPSPLRHLWSLAIEEQWYLLWPVALTLLLRARRWLVPVLLAAALASAALMAVVFDPAEVSRAYYGTDTRAQALVLGAVLAAVLRPHRLVPAGGVLGLVALAGLFTLAHGTDPWLYRGGFALVAVASVAVVAAAVAPSGPVRRLLAVRPLPAVGRISYGLYLWHWPVYVALTPTRVGPAGAPLLALRLVATASLAAVSYRLVEQPIRTARLRLPRPAVPAALAAVAVLVVASTVGAALPGAPVASARPATPAADVDRGPARVLVTGDSVALTLSAHVPAELLGGRAEVTSEAILGCGVIRVDRHAGPFIHVPAEDCRTWPQRWQRAIDRLRPDVAVLLLGAWEVFDIRLDGARVPFGAPAHEALLRRELRTALDVLGTGRTEVLVLTTPCFAHFDQAEFRMGSERNDPERVRWVNRMLREAVAGRPDARLVDFGARLCPGGRFRSSIGGVRVRADDGVHLHPDGLALVWSWLLPDVLSAAGRARSGP